MLLNGDKKFMHADIPPYAPLDKLRLKTRYLAYPTPLNNLKN